MARTLAPESLTSRMRSMCLCTSYIITHCRCVCPCMCVCRTAHGPQEVGANRRRAQAMRCGPWSMAGTLRSKGRTGVEAQGGLEWKCLMRRACLGLGVTGAPRVSRSIFSRQRPRRGAGEPELRSSLVGSRDLRNSVLTESCMGMDSCAGWNIASVRRSRQRASGERRRRAGPAKAFAENPRAALRPGAPHRETDRPRRAEANPRRTASPGKATPRGVSGFRPQRMDS